MVTKAEISRRQFTSSCLLIPGGVWSAACKFRFSLDDAASESCLVRRFSHVTGNEFVHAFTSVGKLDSDRFAIAPAHAAGAFAPARRDAQHELVRDGGGNHFGNF